MVSLRRLEEFLNTESPENYVKVSSNIGEEDTIAVRVTNGSFKWFTEESEMLTDKSSIFIDKFQNLNFSVRKGELVVLTGMVGVGKSSMLADLVGDMGGFREISHFQHHLSDAMTTGVCKVLCVTILFSIANLMSSGIRR